MGLKEVVSQLVSSASAAESCSRFNYRQMLPVDLARENGHNELADFLDDFKVKFDLVYL